MPVRGGCCFGGLEGDVVVPAGGFGEVVEGVVGEVVGVNVGITTRSFCFDGVDPMPATSAALTAMMPMMPPTRIATPTSTPIPTSSCLRQSFSSSIETDPCRFGCVVRCCSL